ncbi:hypothetical protein AGMMS50212_13030 [Spirochaetia bacterium]|nr:hypothetical protein AGMMS50212_13030 [Spirochaetia bacterium]
MKTVDIGKYILKNADSGKVIMQLKKDVVNSVGIIGGDVTPLLSANKINDYDIVFIVRLLDYVAEYGIIHSSAEESTAHEFQRIGVGEILSISGLRLKISFECADSEIESIVDAFKNKELNGNIDIKEILLRYAKIERISEKQALCHIITTIDIPEIDECRLKY